MIIAGLDERKVGAAFTGAQFVVFFTRAEFDSFHDLPIASWEVDSYLLQDCNVSEVLDWAGSNAPHGWLFSIGVVTSREKTEASGAEEASLDLIWIYGTDPNEGGDETDKEAGARLRQMWTLLLRNSKPE